MATAPTPEDAARRILAIFSSKDRRAGEVVRMNVFQGAFPVDGWRSDDFDAGLEYAVESGWVEMASGSLKLTDAGFAEA
jgi:hypothetical protein